MAFKVGYLLTSIVALHFKLATANESSPENYDERQCTYVPQLDPSRDQALMELLPDYLVDEITFPRNQAAKFYSRVVKALTEKPLEVPSTPPQVRRCGTKYDLDGLLHL